ncbi:HET-domain-containing protein, partial [Periconia macrospinosa]
MPKYQYSPLSDVQKNIRLLKILPSVSDDAEIHVELFEYSLQNSRHSYEALSYVWGEPHPARSIYVDNEHFDVTPNLYSALLQLRDHSLPRYIWIDAVCINQQDYAEKATQIQSMAKIYANAKLVVVYLGEAADGSNEALEAIRAASVDPSKGCNQKDWQAVDKLLQRGWFDRVWATQVLQEVAAARHIVVICGHVEMDGYAICLGVENLKSAYARAEAHLGNRTVFTLMREAIFRPKFDMNSGEGASLGICSMGELTSMFNTHKATVLHDKVFALLGMASGPDYNNLEEYGLLPDYRVPWEDLLRRLVRFILGPEVRIETWPGEEKVEIFGECHILGRVSEATSNSSGSQTVEVIYNKSLDWSETYNEHNGIWKLRASANEVKKGDIVCFLGGSKRFTIIRQKGLLFYIIIIDAPSKMGITSALVPRDIALIWDWTN